MLYSFTRIPALTRITGIPYWNCFYSEYASVDPFCVKAISHHSPNLNFLEKPKYRVKNIS